MNAVCPYCGAATQPRARFCPACGRSLLAAGPPSPTAETDQSLEATLPVHKRIAVSSDALDLRVLINVVESAMRWWQDQLTSSSSATQLRASEAIEDLSRILHSLAQQLALGRETIQITRRLPALRVFPIGCPICGHGNRVSAKFCQVCGTLLADPAQQGQGVGNPMPLRLNVAARTDQGRVRRNNQDAVYTGTIALTGGGVAHLCLVADGMGGAVAGEHASRIASEVTRIQVQATLGAKSPPNDQAWQLLLRQASRAANRRVYEEAHAHAEQKGMGTTLTVALIVGDRLHIASVGDSRAYLINANGVTEDGSTTAQLTSDHSLVARLVDIGQITPEQARTHPQKNLLYRSIGTDPSVEVDTFSEQLEPGDIVLLCSDGLINHVRDEEIAQAAIEQGDPDRACEQLVALANERGGRDNISVVIVRVERDK